MPHKFGEKKLSQTQIFKNGIELYTGGKVDSIDTFNDPLVQGTVALRTRSNGKTHDWLLCHIPKDVTPKWVERNLEECEYQTWPPSYGTYQFF